MKFGPLEIGLILVIILIVFGVGKLPQVGGAIGKSIRNFKKSQTGDDEEAEAKPKVQASVTSEEKVEKKSV